MDAWRDSRGKQHKSQWEVIHSEGGRDRQINHM